MYLGLLLTSCVVPPSNSVPTSSTSSSTVSSSNESTTQSSVLPSSLISSQSTFSETIYLDVVQIQKNFAQLPMTASIYVRMNGDILNKPLVLQGVWLIANDFYQNEFNEIGTKTITLNVLLFNQEQVLTSTPFYGSVQFLINESEALLGIQLTTEEIVLP